MGGADQVPRFQGLRQDALNVSIWRVPPYRFDDRETHADPPAHEIVLSFDEEFIRFLKSISNNGDFGLRWGA